MAFRATPTDRATIERLAAGLRVSRSEVIRLSVRAFDELRSTCPRNANDRDAPRPPHNYDDAPSAYTDAGADRRS